MMARPQDELAVLRRFVALQLAAPPAPLPGDALTAMWARSLALALCWTRRPAAIWPTSAAPTCPGCSSISPAAPRGRAPCCMGASRSHRMARHHQRRHSGEYDPTRFVCRVRHQF
ncbi:MAG: hypothetical protein R2854_21140 [Caldilineaceae bacterium]